MERGYRRAWVSAVPGPPPEAPAGTVEWLGGFTAKGWIMRRQHGFKPGRVRSLCHEVNRTTATLQPVQGVDPCAMCHRLALQQGLPLPAGAGALDDSGRPPFGERHHRAKVTEAQVREIRQRAAAGESRSALAAEYGLRYDAVGKIVRREAWKHVT